MNLDIRDLLEYIVPFIFVVFWVLGGIFKGKKSDKEREQAPQHRTDNRDKGRRPSPLEEMFGIELEESFEEVEPELAMNVEQTRAEVSIRDYEAELRAQQKKIQETKDKAQRIARKKRNKAYEAQSTGLNPFAKELVSMLKTPYATKKAMMSYEILGTPVGMRENGQMKQSWES